MDIRLLGSIFRLRQLAQQFGHFWSYAIEAEDLAEIYHRSADFAEFQKNLSDVCGRVNIAPVGGRYLEDAVLENGWLTAVFGGNDQLRVAIHPEQKLIRAEYVNGSRYTIAVYNSSDGALVWETPASTARDAIRILKTIAILAENDSRAFINAHLPEHFQQTEEARLYSNVPSWSYLWISPAVLEDVLPAR